MGNADEILANIVARLRTNPEVQAAWLAGSRGRGTADEFSDLDIWVALDDSAMPPVLDDPLAFIHAIAPTLMHILAPSIAPTSGAFIGTWVPVGESLVQVDWYITPSSTASRDDKTLLIFGDVPMSAPVEIPAVPADYKLVKARDNLILALLMISNMVKHAKRGSFWRAVDHARHVDRCLLNSQSFLDIGMEPDSVMAQNSFLPEPPPITVHQVQNLAYLLLDEVQHLDSETNAGLNPAVNAMRNLVDNWRNSETMQD